ncbi:hypothetical protein [Gleimia europaea]|uniref:hypothetical protein n=1 Tax=Gleimia europaea TaxID=66228 RepID=UPI0003A055E1|nr:hypothetical protein [Gleimia europaea]
MVCVTPAHKSSYFTGTPWATYDDGDNIIVIGQVTDFSVNPNTNPPSAPPG